MKINCCICGKEIVGFGNDPWPSKDSGCCCSECNSTVVIQARIEMLVREKVLTDEYQNRRLS